MPKFKVDGVYRGFDGTGYASRTVEAKDANEAREMAYKPGFWNEIDFISVVLTGNEYTVADEIADIYEVKE